MKQTLASLLLIALISSSALAQIKPEDIPLEPQVSHVFYSDNDISTKMANAKSWIAKAFGDYKSVLQFEDNDKYRIIIKGVSDFESSHNFETGGYDNEYVNFTITFDFKEDRYRILIDDIKIHEIKQLFRGGMIHDNEWSLSSLEPSAITTFYVRDITTQLDSLNNLQGLSKQDVRKNEKKKKKLQEDLIKREEELTKENAKAEYRINKYKQIISDLFNSASAAISETDDF